MADIRHSHRLQEIDCLRGIAALAVVLYHYTSQYHHLWQRPAPAYEFTYGAYGVDLFFMISGFVIPLSIMRISRGRDFVVGRFNRLFPTYWVCLALTSVVSMAAAIPYLQVPLAHRLVNVTMVQSYLGFQHVDGAYWSLQVELFFYGGILASWYTGVFQRQRRWLIAGWLAGALVLEHLLPLAIGKPYLWNKMTTLVITPYAHLFMIGMACHDLHGRGRFGIFHGAVFAAGIAVTALREPWDVTLLTAAFAAVMGLAALGRLRWLARSRTLLFLGGISYPLYLLHENIGFAMIDALEKTPLGYPGAAIVTLGCVVALSHVVHRAVELPSQRWLKGLYKRWQNRSPALVPGAPAPLPTEVP